LIYFLKTFPEIRFCIIHVHETIRFLPLRKRTVVIGLKNGEMATDKKKTHNNSLWIRQEKWIRTEVLSRYTNIRINKMIQYERRVELKDDIRA
jgi:hypothetical protein